MLRLVRLLLLAAVVLGVTGTAEARPGAGAAAVAPAAELVHVVQPGQSLKIIAKRYHTTPEAIGQHNGLPMRGVLKPGTELRIVETTEHAAWRARFEPRDRREPTADRNGRGEDRSGLQRKTGAHAAAPATSANKWARKGSRPGFVTVMRGNESFRGQLRASNGKVVAKSAERIDWLLRSYKTNDRMKIDRRLVKLISDVSDHFGGRPLLVVSGYRPYSPRQYTKNSRHNHGQALDFRIDGVPNIALYEHCLTLQQVGCGYYPNSVFVHMDVRLLKTRWVDYSGPGEAPRYRRPKTSVASGVPGAAPASEPDPDGSEDDDPEPEDEPE